MKKPKARRKLRKHCCKEAHTHCLWLFIGSILILSESILVLEELFSLSLRKKRGSTGRVGLGHYSKLMKMIV